MASSMKPFFISILHSKNSVKTRLHRSSHIFSKQNRWLRLFSLEIKVVLVKKKNTVEGYTSVFVFSSSLRSSPFLRRFSIVQATIRRDYLRWVLFQLFFWKFVLVQKKNTVEGYASLFILLSEFVNFKLLLVLYLHYKKIVIE